jgi:hypothetical protein
MLSRGVYGLYTWKLKFDKSFKVSHFILICSYFSFLFSSCGVSDATSTDQHLTVVWQPTGGSVASFDTAHIVSLYIDRKGIAIN